MSEFNSERYDVNALINNRNGKTPAYDRLRALAILWLGRSNDSADRSLPLDGQQAYQQAAQELLEVVRLVFPESEGSRDNQPQLANQDLNEALNAELIRKFFSDLTQIEDNQDGT